MNVAKLVGSLSNFVGKPWEAYCSISAGMGGRVDGGGGNLEVGVAYTVLDTSEATVELVQK